MYLFLSPATDIFFYQLKNIFYSSLHKKPTISWGPYLMIKLEINSQAGIKEAQHSDNYILNPLQSINFYLFINLSSSLHD